MKTEMFSRTSSKWVSEVTTRGGKFDVSFGFCDRDGFTIVAPTKTYRSATGARKAAQQWVAR